MRKYISILVVMSSLSAFGQAWTNLSVLMQPIFLAMTPTIQTNTLNAWADYTRAVNRSPEFKGVITNTSVVITPATNGVDITYTTNAVTIMTTNRPPLTFVQYYTIGLQHEKIGRIVEQRNIELYTEMYRKVGQTVVDAWP